MNPSSKKKILRFFVSLLIGVIGFLVTVGFSSAGPIQQEETGEEVHTSDDCKECHLDVTSQWEVSPHAHAYSDKNFQTAWENLQKPGECLTCHTTGYNANSGTFESAAIDCSACHGFVTEGHPENPVPIKADTEYCGQCHTTTLTEWRQTAHSSSKIGCMDCHNPHSQKRLFEVSDEMCINCHQDSMEKYLEDIHIEKGIGCVDCHALVIPPDPIPETGIVPTGHGFNITPATCVACHTDALHAGFSLPGYESGAANGASTEAEPVMTETIQKYLENGTAEEAGMTVEQQLQALEASQASRNVTLLFQGGFVGLVLGGSTAWFMAMNSRFTHKGDTNEEKREEE